LFICCRNAWLVGAKLFKEEAECGPNGVLRYLETLPSSLRVGGLKGGSGKIDRFVISVLTRIAPRPHISEQIEEWHALQQAG
jgi:hypothetical protein